MVLVPGVAAVVILCRGGSKLGLSALFPDGYTRVLNHSVSRVHQEFFHQGGEPLHLFWFLFSRCVRSVGGVRMVVITRPDRAPTFIFGVNPWVPGGAWAMGGAMSGW